MKIYNKCLLILVWACFAVSIKTSAQMNKIVTSIDAHVSAYDKEFAPLELGVEVGYGFTKWLLAGVRLEKSFAHVETNDVRTYFDNATCGLTANCDVLKFGTGVLTLKGSVGSSLKDEEWKYCYYNGELCISAMKCDMRKTLGVGVRFYDGRGDGIGEKFRVYMSVGFAFALK